MAHHLMSGSSSGEFMPHGFCFLWNPALLWTFVLSESIIALSYFSIPISLLYFISRRKDISFSGIFLLFSYFILFCGLTHVMGAWVIWHPNYWLQAVTNTITAAFSAMTAVALWLVIPKALKIPNSHELEDAITQLQSTLNELKITQNKLVESEKMSALGALVAGVAHELNTPMGNALTSATTLMDANQTFVKQSSQGIRRTDLDNLLRLHHEGTDILLRNLHKAITLIASFKDLSIDRFMGQRTKFTMQQVVDDALVMFQIRGSDRPFSIHLDIESTLVLESYPAALSRVINNLLDYAWARHIVDDNVHRISIEARQHGPEQMQLIFHDHAYSTDADHVKHLFEPFYTLKLGDQDIGLGLHICYNLVTGPLGGSIRVNSEEGQGTHFHLQLPRQAPNISSHDVFQEETGIPGAGLTYVGSMLQSNAYDS
ncbi:MAG: HAMP domain-containing histidine kinase [Pseudomonadales bacterium]|nr:HAMP domain-containing histidine kinase [Pseudomonadales bacterium]